MPTFGSSSFVGRSASTTTDGDDRMMQDESTRSSLNPDGDADSISDKTGGSPSRAAPLFPPTQHPNDSSFPPVVAPAAPATHAPTTTTTTTTSTPAGPVLMLVWADKYDYRLQGGWQKQDYRPLNERYRNWRKNTCYMYDFFAANVTVHPSRTVEWLPDIKRDRLNVPLQGGGGEEAVVTHAAATRTSSSSVGSSGSSASKSADTSAVVGKDRRKTVDIEFYCQKAIVGSLNGLEGLRGAATGAAANAAAASSMPAPDIQHAIFVLDIRIPINDGENYDINAAAQYGQNDWGSNTITRIECTKFVPVGNREVFRVRHMPQLSDLVAVRTRDEPYIGIYDLQNALPFESYSAETTSSHHQPSPVIALHGFAVGSSGYGLDWHRHTPGYVVAASYEPKIAIWNIEHNNKSSSHSTNGSTSCSTTSSIKSRRNISASQQQSSSSVSSPVEVLPLRTYEYHTKAVQEVAWHPDSSCRSLFVSVGDDGMLGVCDIRESPTRANFKPALFTKAHDYPINTVAWSPAARDCATLVATGAMDGTIGLWDLRRPDMRLHTIVGCHTADIVQIAFNPHDPLVLASAGLDNHLLIFDLGCIGAEKFVNVPQHDALPSELVFVHAGHSAPVNEFSWSPYYDRMLLSVADDNMVQCTEISEQAWSTWHRRRNYGPLAMSMTPPVELVTKKTALDADEIPPQEEPPTAAAGGAAAAVAGAVATNDLLSSSRRQQWKLHTAPEFRFAPGVLGNTSGGGGDV